MAEMADMKETFLYHMLHTKAKEEELQSHNPEKLAAEVVQIRDEPLQALKLFPWEMTKLLIQSDLTTFVGLELNHEFVHIHLFRRWSGRNVEHAWLHQQSLPIKVYDIDTGSDHEVLFQKCYNQDKYFLQGGWTGNFVQRRGLIVGMQIGMYWDTRKSIICFSVLNDNPESTSSSTAIIPADNPAGSSEGGINLELSL